MKINLIIIVLTTIIGSLSFAKITDPFAGQTATCTGDTTATSEMWTFVGMTKEFTKEFKVAGVAIVQKGKYNFQKDKLTIHEYKHETKELNPERKFNLKAAITQSGFEYMWKTPKGEEIAHTCTWKK